MTRDHWKQASTVWLRRVELSLVFGAATRKRQSGLKKMQPKVFQVDSYLLHLLNRPLCRIRRFGTLLCELWFADCVRNRRTVCLDRNSEKPTVLALDTVQTKGLQWRLILAAVSSHSMHPVSHTVCTTQQSHTCTMRFSLLERVWSLTKAAILKIRNHFQKRQRKKFTVVKG